MAEGVTIENLKQFRADLRVVDAASPRMLTKAIRAAGVPIVAAASGLASRASVTGEHAKGFQLRAAGTTGRLFNKAPYGAGAEWGRSGKWAGFNRYGGPGRFGWKAVELTEDEVARVMHHEMDKIITLLGWARP